MVNQYEHIRKQNVDDNRRILAELGILNPFKPLGRVIKKSVKRKRHNSGSREWQPKKQAVEDDAREDYGSIRGSRRRSSRILGKDVPTEEDLKDEVDRFVEEEQSSRMKVKPNRPNFYGAVADVEIGTLWQTRLEACQVGVHRPTVAGIHGGEDGAYSIALSGGYEDDIDLGECFTYTGEGGRDLKGTKTNPKNLRTAAQSRDQTLTRGNLALSRNVETGNPVRVIRGYKLRSPFAPEEGYRYDGVYTVKKAWFTTGLSGFGVWKFALSRIADQPSPPWSLVECGENQTSPRKCESEKSTKDTNLFKVKTEKSATEDGSTDSTPSKDGTSSDNLTDGEINTANNVTNQDTDVSNESTNEAADQTVEGTSSDNVTEEPISDKNPLNNSNSKTIEVTNENPNEATVEEASSNNVIKEPDTVTAQSTNVKEEQMDATTVKVKSDENGGYSINDETANKHPTSDTKNDSEVDSDSGVNSEPRTSFSQSSEGSASSLSE